MILLQSEYQYTSIYNQFQVISNADDDELIECLHTYKYNCTTGPLWCVRLRPVEASTFLSVPSVCLEGDHETKFPHCYHLFLGFHHSIGDATSCMEVCGTLVSLIDDVLAGSVVDDEVQIGSFDINEEFEQLKSRYRAQIHITEQKDALKMESELGMGHTSKLVDVLHVPDGTERKTLTLTQIWDPTTTSNFFRRCKAVHCDCDLRLCCFG